MIRKIIGVTLFCFAAQTIAGLPKHNPVQGGIAVIPLENIHTKTKPIVKFLDHRVLVTQDDKANWLAIVGIPISYKPGSASLTIKTYDHKVSEIKFDVQQKKYPEQRLTIKDQNKVTPSTKSIERIKREREELNMVLANWRPKEVESLTFQEPVAGRKSSGYGLRRVYNNVPGSPHRGLDIAAPVGTPIQAALGGVVSFTADLFYTGNTVVVDHGQGFQTLYCHLDKIQVKRGDIVKTNEIIGTVGKTGRATGPHLHLGVNLNQQRVDPEMLLE